MQVKYKFHDFHKAAARPAGRCDMRPPALLQIIIIHSRDSTFMFTFTYIYIYSRFFQNLHPAVIQFTHETCE